VGLFHHAGATGPAFVAPLADPAPGGLGGTVSRKPLWLEGLLLKPEMQARKMCLRDQQISMTRETCRALRSSKLLTLWLSMHSSAFHTGAALWRLQLVNVSLDNDGAVAVARGLKYCNKLAEINLMTNWIGDRGAAALGSAIKSRKAKNAQTRSGFSATKLILDENQVQCNGARALVTGMRQSRWLQELHIADNCIALSGEEALLQAGRDGVARIFGLENQRPSD
jgi:hypothetical protein